MLLCVYIYIYICICIHDVNNTDPNHLRWGCWGAAGVGGLGGWRRLTQETSPESHSLINN